MGILPIGFFSPLPLAMMIPFMATQSLAMGEAFGKSFQYGKRKISSLSNEEFNKLTFHDLMVEQTANISAIVPELTKQMAQSQVMQQAIFQEMVKLIPTFFDSLFSAFKPEQVENSTQSPFFKNTQATQQAPITNIRYTTDRDPVFNEPAIRSFQQAIDPLLQQRGTREQTASEKEAIRAYNQQQLANRTPLPPTIENRISTSRDTTNEEQQSIQWQTRLVSLQKEFTTINRQYQNTKSYLSKTAQASNSQGQSARISKLRSIVSKIRTMSNDYRSPNNITRQLALKLRQQIANGMLKY